MFGLAYFKWEEVWSPVFLAAILIVAAAYLVLTGPVHDKLGMGTPVTTGRKALFLLGLGVFYAAQGGPIELLGHIMFSFHMVSMALSYLIAPPLLMLGLPDWVWRRLLEWPSRSPLSRLRFLAHPVVAAVVFNGLFSLYHFPGIHDYVMLHFAVHRLYYVVLFVAAVLMWWTLVKPLPDHSEVHGLKQMGFIFLNMVLLTPACGLIIFAPEALYATYSDPGVWAKAMGYCISGDPGMLLSRFGGPEFFGYLEPAIDQQVGGIIMKFIQEIIFASMLAYVFFQWYKQENREEDESNLQGEDAQVKLI